MSWASSCPGPRGVLGTLVSWPLEVRDPSHLKGGEGKPPHQGRRRKATTTQKAPAGERPKHNTTHNNTTNHHQPQTQQHNTSATQPPTHSHSSTRHSAHHVAPPSLSPVLSLVSRLLSSASCLRFCLVCLDRAQPSTRRGPDCHFPCGAGSGSFA